MFNQESVNTILTKGGECVFFDNVFIYDLFFDETTAKGKVTYSTVEEPKKPFGAITFAKEKGIDEDFDEFLKAINYHLTKEVAWLVYLGVGEED